MQYIYQKGIPVAYTILFEFCEMDTEQKMLHILLDYNENKTDITTDEL